MWIYEFSKEAEKFLIKQPRKLQELITQKIKNIGDWLDDRSKLAVDVRKLYGEWDGFYRLRIGKIRVLFSVDEEKEIIRVHAIGYRGDIYK